MDDPLWARLSLQGFSRVDQLISELCKPVHLSNLFDSSAECVELVKGIHGSEYVLHEVVADADILMQWKRDSQAELDRLIRLDRQSSKRYCLRPATHVSASDTYEQLLGMGVKLQCHVSRSTFRARLRDPTASKNDIETAARTRWLKVLVSFLVEADLPVISLAQQTSEPQLTMEMAFGCRRMRTLRARARSWQKVVSWMVMFRGYSHPRHVSDMVDYVIFLQQEGVTRGQLDGVCASLSVIEDAGQVPIDQRICSHRLWLQTTKTMLAELDQVAKPVHKAPPLSVAMIIALEVMVTEDGYPLYARALAWIILVCVWACMRISDLEGLSPSRITLSSRGLRGMLSKTKTTGPGKQVREVPIFIARNVAISGNDWLPVGWRLWNSFGLLDRDYFVFAASQGLEKPILKYASVEKIASYVRVVLYMLNKPCKQRYSGWRCKDESLLSEDSVMFWSGHSMRHFLPTISAAIQVGKEQRDYLGRWHVGLHQSSDYIHTSRQIVTDIQEKVSKAICTGDPSYDESELTAELATFLAARGDTSNKWIAGHNVWRMSGTGYNIGMTWPTIDQHQLEVDGMLQSREGLEISESDAVDKKSAEETPNPKYFVVVSRKSGFRRLHKVGCCGVQPTECYRVEWVDQVAPKSADAQCKSCLKTCGKMVDVESSSSGSSSSSEEAVEEEALG